MKTILFIHQSAELYGSDKTILLFISNLDKSKYKPIVILPFEGPLKRELEKNNIKVIIAPVLKLYRKMFSPKNILNFIKEYFVAIKILNKLHKEHKFDLVYSHTLASLIGMFFAKKNKVKHLWHVQEIIAKPKLINCIFKKILSSNYTDFVAYDSIETMNFWATNSKLKVKSDFVWNSLDLKSIPLTESSTIQNVRRTFFDASENEIVIGLIGRINSWKGQMLLLEAFNKLEDKKKLKLVFVGSAPPNQEFFETNLISKIKEYQLEKKAIIIPFKENIWDFWNSIDIAVVPSTEPEPFGMVAIEAMNCKKPVVAANHGGLKEIVVNNTTGLLFEPKNSDDLKLKLQTLILSGELRDSLGNKGQERVKEHFTIDKHVEKFDLIFKKMDI